MAGVGRSRQTNLVNWRRWNCRTNQSPAGMAAPRSCRAGQPITQRSIRIGNCPDGDDSDGGDRLRHLGLGYSVCRRGSGEAFSRQIAAPRLHSLGGTKVKTYDWWTVPPRGRIKIELIEAKAEVEQAADVKIEDGHLTLTDGTEVPLLRTWADPRSTASTLHLFWRLG